MAEAKKVAPRAKPQTETATELSAEERIEAMRVELEKEKAEFEAAKAAYDKAKMEGPGAQGHGLKLAPNEMQVNQNKRLWLNGGSPSGISQVTRIALEAVVAHCEGFIADGLTQTPGMVAQREVPGAIKGQVPIK